MSAWDDPQLAPYRLIAERELTARQLEVIRLLAEGATLEGSADRLGVSVSTIRTTRRDALRKIRLALDKEAA